MSLYQGRILVAVARFQIYSTADTQFTWRLLSANNRSLGRSARAYRSTGDCEAAVADLCGRLPALVASTVRQDGHWRWRLSQDGVVRVVSTRDYQRQLQAVSACRNFLDLAPRSAVLDLSAVARFLSSPCS